MQITFATSSEAPPSAVLATDNNEPHPGGRSNASMANHQASCMEVEEASQCNKQWNAMHTDKYISLVDLLLVLLAAEY